MGNNYWLMVIGLLVVYAVVLYFLSIRPQKKQEKKMQAMLDSLEVGDSVETSAGLFGVVIDIPMRRQAVVNIEKANSVEE